MYEPNEAQTADDGQPTSAAFVSIRTFTDGPSVNVGVPAEQSGLLVGAVTVAAGVGGSIVGPYLMARALHVMAPGTPWQLQSAMLCMAALLPLVYFLLDRRRG
ncbi:hypothetical protein [Streptomyces sp. NPDC048489]|uniref:hypothetical protein n=1 Tax=Streptomyces sp. NPDC048489 TaxID=3154504 RepID=UPI0034182F8F